MLPVQINLSHFSLSSLIHMMVVLLFFSGLAPGYMSIYMKYFTTNFSTEVAISFHNVADFTGGSDRFASVLPVALLPLGLATVQS